MMFQNGQNMHNSAAHDSFIMILIVNIASFILLWRHSKIEKLEHNSSKEFLLQRNSIPWLAISLAIGWRSFPLRQNYFQTYTYRKLRNFLLYIKNILKWFQFSFGHTKLSLQSQSIRFKIKLKVLMENMPTGPKQKVVKKKKVSSKQTKEDRAEQYLQEAKAKSKARVEAKMKKKKTAQEEADKQHAKYWNDEEKKALAETKRKNDEEYKEVEALAKLFEEEAKAHQEQLEQQKLLSSASSNTAEKSGDVEMTDVSSEDLQDTSDDMDKQQDMEIDASASDDEKDKEVASDDSVETDQSNHDADNHKDASVEKSTPDKTSDKLGNDGEKDSTGTVNKQADGNNSTEKGDKDGPQQNHMASEPAQVSPGILSYIRDEQHKATTGGDDEDGNSVGTENAGNQSKRNINEALNGYKTPSITQHVVYCKAKIQIPSNEKPTEQLRNTLGMFLTTLLKVDKDFVLYFYNDESNAGYIKLPTQVPEVILKIKLYFHGRYRPNSAANAIWPELRIGFNVDSETFFEDAKGLLDDKGNYGLYRKEIQAAETVVAGFLLSSNVYQDRARVKKAILHQCAHIFLFYPEITLRWRKVNDPSIPKAQWKQRNKAKPTENDQDTKALHVEVIKGMEDKMISAMASMYSKQYDTGPGDGKNALYSFPRPCTTHPNYE